LRREVHIAMNRSDDPPTLAPKVFRFTDVDEFETPYEGSTSSSRLLYGGFRPSRVFCRYPAAT
jgi:hypothetical protein